MRKKLLLELNIYQKNAIVCRIINYQIILHQRFYYEDII